MNAARDGAWKWCFNGASKMVLLQSPEMVPEWSSSRRRHPLYSLTTPRAASLGAHNSAKVAHLIGMRWCLSVTWTTPETDAWMAPVTNAWMVPVTPVTHTWMAPEVRLGAWSAPWRLNGASNGAFWMPEWCQNCIHFECLNGILMAPEIAPHLFCCFWFNKSFWWKMGGSDTNW